MKAIRRTSLRAPGPCNRWGRGMLKHADGRIYMYTHTVGERAKQARQGRHLTIDAGPIKGSGDEVAHM